MKRMSPPWLFARSDFRTLRPPDQSPPEEESEDQVNSRPEGLPGW
jgi:hypothetical protein